MFCGYSTSVAQYLYSREPCFFIILLYLLHTTAQDPHHHNTCLWMFGKQGVQISTPNSALVVKSILPERV